jgi:hypothetical protein
MFQQSKLLLMTFPETPKRRNALGVFLFWKAKLYG